MKKKYIPLRFARPLKRGQYLNSGVLLLFRKFLQTKKVVLE